MTTTLIIAGAVLVAAGVALISPPALLILAGLGVLRVAQLRTR